MDDLTAYSIFLNYNLVTLWYLLFSTHKLLMALNGVVCAEVLL